MKFPYPQSTNCSFDNFPVAIDVRLGSLASIMCDGASFGSKYFLTQTPKSGVLQGNYVVGEEIPSLEKIYSDTGHDDEFNLKISFLGHGSFYRRTSNDLYLRAQIYKAIRIETNNDTGIVFGDVFDCETLIPATDDISVEFAYDPSVVQCVDPIPDEVYSSGTFVYGGKSYTLASGQSITFSSENGNTLTFRFVNGGLFVG